MYPRPISQTKILSSSIPLLLPPNANWSLSPVDSALPAPLKISQIHAPPPYLNATALHWAPFPLA